MKDNANEIKLPPAPPPAPVLLLGSVMVVYIDNRESDEVKKSL
jgi:hypothetical protein